MSDSFPFVQSIENARAERVGPHGVAADALAAMLAHTQEALEWLRARHDDGTLPLLRLPETRSDLGALSDVARRLGNGATDIVLLGTGGSSLGGQTLAQLTDHAVPGAGALRPPPRLHFMDNLDPATFGTLLERLPLATTRFVAISKSGGTGETLMQTITTLSALQQAGFAARLPELVLGLSEPLKGNKRNGLRELLTRHNIPLLDHDPGVGGRYSVLTNVGLLPAAVAGLDITAIRAGAARAVAPVLAKKPAGDVPPAVGAALSIALAGTGTKPITVLMPYADRLAWLSKWYVQLWAESLGKAGLG